MIARTRLLVALTVAAWALAGCATTPSMTPEQKKQHLAEYEKISRQKAIELFGPNSDLFLAVAKNIASSKNSKQIKKNLIFASRASVNAIGDTKAIDQQVAYDVKAMDETFTGAEIEAIVKVFRSEKGVAFQDKANALKTQYVLNAIASDAAKRKVYFQEYKKAVEEESIKLAPAFNTPKGRSALGKWTDYLKRKKQYQTNHPGQGTPITLKEFVRRMRANGA